MRTITFAAAVSIAILLTGCDSGPAAPLGNAAKLAAGVESDYTIQITGTPNIKFSGGYMVMKPDGSSTQKSLDGKTPMEIKVRGAMISTSFQKQAQRGQLIAVVLRDGKEVSRSDTDAEYGVVSVATQ